MWLPGQLRDKHRLQEASRTLEKDFMCVILTSGFIIFLTLFFFILISLKYIYYILWHLFNCLKFFDE